MARERDRTDLSPAKREQILRGARSLFREHGYERASVDAIAARAGVSKATIYNHFRDKKALFLATFAAETAASREKFLGLLEVPTGEIEQDLRRIGEEMLRLVTAPSQVHRFRIVVAEADRFPELGRALYECGTVVARERMTHFFDQAGSLGLLEIHEPSDAADDFWSLCTCGLSRLLHLGIVEEATEAMIARAVDRAVTTFLRAYLPRS